MNKFILLCLLVMQTSAVASESCSTSEEQVKEQMTIKTDVPKHLEGAVIIVRTKDGRESTVPAEKFKVVPRKQQFIVTRTERNTSCVSSQSKNRISALGGHGAQGGLKSSSNGSVAEVESKTGFVGGAQYQRMLNDTLSLGVQFQSNKTGSAMIGIDF